MILSDIQANAQKTVAIYEKLGMRRVAKVGKHPKRATQFYLDLTNLWKTKSEEQAMQYNAIRDSGLFSDERATTFLRFNYRNCEKGTYNYPTAFRKLSKKPGSTPGRKGTMQVTDLWSEASMQTVMGTLAYPRDRLKILKVWAKSGVPDKQSQTARFSRFNTEP